MLFFLGSFLGFIRLGSRFFFLFLWRYGLRFIVFREGWLKEGRMNLRGFFLGRVGSWCSIAFLFLYLLFFWRVEG